MCLFSSCVGVFFVFPYLPPLLSPLLWELNVLIAVLWFKMELHKACQVQIKMQSEYWTPEHMLCVCLWYGPCDGEAALFSRFLFVSSRGFFCCHRDAWVMSACSVLPFGSNAAHNDRVLFSSRADFLQAILHKVTPFHLLSERSQLKLYSANTLTQANTHTYLRNYLWRWHTSKQCNLLPIPLTIRTKCLTLTLTLNLIINKTLKPNLDPQTAL